MPKMTLTKEQAVDMMDDEATHLRSTVVGKSRWANEHELIFERDGKLWSVIYREGTGDEGEVPFEHDTEVVCTEVEAFERVVVDYRTVRDPAREGGET